MSSPSSLIHPSGLWAGPHKPPLAHEKRELPSEIRFVSQKAILFLYSYFILYAGRKRRTISRKITILAGFWHLPILG